MKWTKEFILQAIKSKAVDGVCKSDDKTLTAMAGRRFGSWIKACRAAGVKALSDLPSYEICVIENCEKRTRSITCPWCEMHYYRNRRNGNPNKLFLKQYQVDETVFDVWNDSSAWLLGLWWSDGWMQKVTQIGIKFKDFQLIETVKKVLNTDQEIKIAKHKGNEYYYLSIANKKLFHRLAELGCHINKSLTIEYPKDFSDEFFGSFYRGMLDGDGTVWLQKNNRKGQQVKDCQVSLVSGSKIFVNQLCAKLDKFGIRYSVSVSSQYLKSGKINKGWCGNDIYRITHTHYASMRTLYELLHPSDDCHCLQRKKDLFKEWYSTPREKAGNPLIKKGYRLGVIKDDVGVNFCQNKWQASIRINGEVLKLGSYFDKDKAILVRKKAFLLVKGGVLDKNLVKREATLGIENDLMVTNSSGTSGVSWDKHRKKWAVQIIKTKLGRFNDKATAIAVKNKYIQLLESGIDKTTLTAY